MGRRGENIRKRKDGSWEARMILCYRPDGKAVYRYLYGKTYSEAKEKRRAAMLEQDTTCAAKRERPLLETTFACLAKEWLAAKRGTVKESTYANYANTVEKQLLPELGGEYITSLTSERLESFLHRKLQSGKLDGSGGLSHKTVSDLRAVLKLILQYGQTHGFPELAMICLPLVGSQPPAIQILTKSEQERLERVLFSEPKPLYLGILTALYAGLRIGEVCALQWKDIHFGDGTLDVSKTIIRIRDIGANAPAKTKVIIDRPKTQCSIRTIPLPDFILSYFKENRRGGDAYLLTGTVCFMEPRVCLKQYKQVLRLAGLQDHNFHSLRHTFATRCVEQDFDVKSLSEIMGHSSVSITMQRYVHPSLERKREQMNKLSTVSICGQIRGQERCEKAESAGNSSLFSHSALL